MRGLLVGIDVGTTNVKAVVIDADGRLVAESAAEHGTIHPHPGWAEQDSSIWWSGTVKVLSRIMSMGISRSEIRALSVSSQAPALLPLDVQGQPLRNALIWMDTRAAKHSQQLRDTIGEATIKAITGNRVDPSYLLSKILWFREHEPQQFARTDRFLTANAYIAYRLTGQYSIDISHASLSQFYDVHRRGWSTQLSEACGVAADLFPDVYETTDVVGHVSRAAADATGLPEGLPVVAGIVDANAAGLAAGVVGSGDGVIVMGTSTVLLMGSDRWVECGNLAEIYHALPGGTVVFGAMSTTGASLKWFRDQFADSERQHACDSGADVYDLLTAEAAESQAGAGNLVFLPYLMGERAPVWDSAARGTLFGLTLNTTRADVIRAILEGVAFGVRHNVQEACTLGLELHRLMAVGGGNSRLWFQIMASVLNTPISLPASSSGAPFGAAVLAGAGVGLISDLRRFLRQTVVVAETLEPVAAWQARYEQLFAVYLNLYRDTKEHMHRLADMS